MAPLPTEIGDAAQDTNRDRVMAWLEGGGSINDVDEDGYNEPVRHWTRAAATKLPRISYKEKNRIPPVWRETSIGK